MPDKDVKTIRDLIYYQYAKIIAKRAFGKEAKKKNYGFIKKTFLELKEEFKLGI
jgi:archaeosine-15-forming tRNA-guanine transglycosylase